MKMPRWMVSGLVGAALVSTSLAQQPADLATLRKQADRLAADVRRAQTEVSFTEETMMRLDSEIEERIGGLVDLILKSKDSLGTDDRIATARASAIAGLRRTLALYVAAREQRRQNGWDTTRVDQRIDLRLEQMTKLAASFGPGEAPESASGPLEDVEMEEAVKGLKAGKFVGSVVQNRKDLVRELEAAVEHLTVQRDTLALQVTVTTDPAQKEKLEKEIAYLDGLADKRRGQIQEALAAKEPEQVAEVGFSTATEIEKGMRAARVKVREGLMELQKLATKRDYQQKRMDYLSAQLAEVKAAIDRLAQQ